MEDNNRNLILAMVLSAIVMLVWSIFFAPEPPPPAPDAAQEQVATTSETGGAAAPGTAGQPATAPGNAAATANADASATAGRIKIESPSLAGSISLAGGRIDDLTDMLGMYDLAGAYSEQPIGSTNPDLTRVISGRYLNGTLHRLAVFGRPEGGAWPVSFEEVFADFRAGV